MVAEIPVCRAPSAPVGALRGAGARVLRAVAASALLLAAAQGCASPPYSERATVRRIGSASFDPEPKGISGIAFIAGDRYVVAADGPRGGLHDLRLPLEDGTACPGAPEFGPRVECVGAADLEGVAYDPSRKEVWASDEKHQTIRAYSPEGEIVGEAPVPDHFKTTRFLMGFESLTIRRDGREMWAANEEALPADGPQSSVTNGTLVRLLRFVREGDDPGWRVAAEYPYRADTIAGGDYKDVQRSGVAGLCSLDDGSLVVLEREMSRGWIIPRIRTRLYLLNLEGAQDVSAIPALSGFDVVPVAKELLFETRGFAMYEGLAMGPVLADGSQTLVLVSDNGSGGFNRLLLLRLKMAEGQ